MAYPTEFSTNAADFPKYRPVWSRLVNIALFGGLLMLCSAAGAQQQTVEVQAGDVAGLRNAIQQANQLDVGQALNITIVPDASGGNPPFQFTDTVDGTRDALPTITRDVRIRPRNPSTRIRFVGNGEGRLVSLTEDSSLLLEDARVSGFSAQGDGGVFDVGGDGFLLVRRSIFEDNVATGSGGVAVGRGSGAITFNDSEFINNRAGNFGGVVSFRGSSNGSFSNNRFTGNQASVFGCDIDINSSATSPFRINNNTFDQMCGNVSVENPVGPIFLSGNTFGGTGASVDSTADAVLIGNIFDANEGGKRKVASKINCRDFGSGAFTSLGFNISNDDSCFLDQPTDQPNTDPMLGSVTPKGNYPLLPGSPAIDGSGDAVVIIDGEAVLPCGYKDGEGLGRPQDANGDGIWECDIGNYEVRNGPDLGPGQSGAFFDATRNGEGAFLEMLNGDLALIAEFSYQPGGTGAAWFIGLGSVVGNSVVIDQMLQPVGGAFGAAFDPDAIDRQQVGGFSMVFSDCEASATPGRMAFETRDSPDFEDILVQAQRLTSIVPCSGSAPAYAGRSGSFFDVNRSGEGVFVQWLSATDVLLIWYTFTPSGEQMWLISDGATFADGVVTAPMLYPTGFAEFGQNFDASDVALSPWGTVTLTYQPGCNQLVFAYDSTVSGYGSGGYTYTRLTNLAGTSCDL